MEPLATVGELAARLDFPVLDDPALKSMAEAALEDATSLVLAEGRPTWTPYNCPHVAKTVVLAAARRHMTNPDGFTTSRSGDEAVGWDGVGGDALAVYLTDAEVKRIRRATNVGTLSAVQTFVFGPNSAPRGGARSGVGYVPAEGGSPFPMFSGDEPW